MTSDNLRASLLMLAGMAAFTFNDALMKAVTADLPLFEVIFLRGLLACGALALLARAQGAWPLRFPRRDRLWLALRVLGEAGSTAFFLVALVHMPLANVTAIIQSVPLAVTLAAALVFREPLGWRRLSAIGIGFCGVLMIVRPGTEGFNAWSVLALVSVGFIVLRDLATRPLSLGVSSAGVALVGSLAVTLMGAAGAAFEDWRLPDAHALALVVGAAAFLVCGYISIVAAVRLGEIGAIAPFRYSGLLWALLLGWLLFGEFPRWITLAGAAVVVATGLFTFYRERQIARAARRAAAG